jgi:hypothetical protein
MASLRASPYNLQFLDLVIVKFNAVNAIGQGQYSDPSIEWSYV